MVLRKEDDRAKGKRRIRKVHGKKDGRRTICLSPYLLVLLGLSIFWTVSMMVTPLLLEPGTVRGLDGTAHLDYGDLWSTLDPYPRAVYTFGDSQCHQKEYRSFILNGNQLPVDARVFSIFLFANVGLIVPFFVRPVYALSPRLLFFLPKRYLVWKSPHVLPVMAFVFIIIMILPVALDGFRQMLTDYESVNILRFLTGIPTGFVGGLLIGSMLNGTYFMGKDLDVG